MSFSTDDIVQEIQAEFESMLTYVKESKTATADQVERGIFKRLLVLGAKLLLWFFSLRAQTYPHTPVATAAGARLPYFADKPRRYFSIFGKLVFGRPYFYQPGVGGASPLDGALSLGDDCYSDLLREIAEYLGVDVTYGKVGELFARILGQPLSTHTVARLVAEDAADVAAYYTQKPAPPPEREGAILVLQADGKGVPIVRATPAAAKVRLAKGEKRTKKKEAIVTGLYTLAPYPRSPAEVVASLFHKETRAKAPEPGAARPKPQSKQLWATLAGKDPALQRLAQQVTTRDGPHIQQRVALTDGCDALQTRVQHYFPAFTLILDFIHADEYLWEAGTAVFGEQSPLREPWVEKQTLALLAGHTLAVIGELRQLAQAPKRRKSQRAALEKAAHYFERNQPYMRYDHYLAQGWPIASGVIEGACRHLVKDRCELSGMRWTLPGAEDLLRLRTVAENGDWEDYHQFRKRQRHARLYLLPFPGTGSIEEQGLEPPHLAGATPAPSDAGRTYTMPKTKLNRQPSGVEKRAA